MTLSYRVLQVTPGLSIRGESKRGASLGQRGFKVGPLSAKYEILEKSLIYPDGFVDARRGFLHLAE